MISQVFLTSKTEISVLKVELMNGQKAYTRRESQKKSLAEILPLPLCEPKYGISFSSSYFLSCKLKGKKNL